MTRSRFVSALGLTLALTTQAPAAPPQVTGTTPFGARRGAATEVNFQGANLGGNPRLVAPFGFRVVAPAQGGADASTWKISLTIDGETPVGVYPVRVVTDDGLSNPFLFAVGQLPQVAEAEDNGTFATAQVIPAPAVVEGQVAGNDVDFYRFAGKKGQKIVIDALCARVGSGVDPTIRLSTAGHAFLASAEDTPGLLTDARLVAVLPADTDYVVELSDARYQGGGRPIYRLVVGEVPMAEEVYPGGGRRGETVGLELRGGTLDGVLPASARMETKAGLPVVWARAQTTPGGLDVESLPTLTVGDLPEVREPDDPAKATDRVAAPAVLNGRIDPAGDEDRFTLSVAPGQKLRIVVEAADRGSALDGVLQVLDAKGGQLALADDTPSPTNPKPANGKKAGTSSPDPSLDFTVPAGQTEVTLALRDLGGRGGIGYPYRISVTTTAAGFSATLNESQVSVPRGGTAAVGVTFARKGYSGPIVLKVANPPAGLSVRPGAVADGQTVGVFTLSAAADAAFGAVDLDVVAEGQGGDGPIVVKAGKALVFATQANLPTNTLPQVGLPAAPSQALGLSLDTPAGAIEVAHGFGVPVVVKVVRDKEATGALAFSAPTLPPGLAVPNATAGEKDDQAGVTVNTTTDLPLGVMSIALVAKGKIGGADRAFDAPALTLNVVRPASIELGSAAVEVKGGTTTEVTGKVVRKSGFKEPVTIKVSGLPAGLKADPVTVAPDASEFTLKIAADEKAAPATAPAVVALSFQVNKKDYPTPPTMLTVKVLPAN